MENDIVRRVLIKRLLSGVCLATALLLFAASLVRAEEADEKKEQEWKKEKLKGENEWKEKEKWKQEGYGSDKGEDHWKTKAGDRGTFGLPTAVVVGGAGYLILRRRTRRA